METSPRIQSVFSQKLDRAVFATYFLGAIVPLSALALVAHRYVLPVFDGDRFAFIALVGGIMGVGVLSLAAFFGLRRITRTALDRMDADNASLSTILSASQNLSTAPHSQAVAEAGAACALDLTKAKVAFLLLQSDPQKPIAPVASAGAKPQSSYQAFQAEISQGVDAALRAQKPITVKGATTQAEGVPRLTAALVVPLRADSGLTGAFVVVQTDPGAEFDPAARDALSTLAALTSVALNNADLRDVQRNFFSHVTELLATALDAHVDGRRGHATRVAQLANRLGREMALEEGVLQRLHFASLLHDIGMLKVDPSKQRDPNHNRRHVTVGHRMLAGIRLWHDVAPIVLYHHEWFDGHGYPEGLVGDTIPLEARIIAVADAYDAMIRDDVQHVGLGIEEALEELRDCAGKQFDPKVVVAFASLAERSEIPS